jgi:hypothetical protein
MNATSEPAPPVGTRSGEPPGEPPGGQAVDRRPAGRPWSGLALGALTTLFLLFGIGALGIVGDGGRADLAYLAAAGVAIVGVLAARLRPRGSALALGAAAAVVVAVALGVLVVGLPADASALDVVGISAMYAGLFAAAAWLCLRADPSPGAGRRTRSG